ncbi:MAG: NAD(P)-dependent glycerol-3-phosphate dehydrogenase [Eubacterium sp.]|nr:NAD(P)-dependent glycerol-3-phosphate dehydrogenase [Eubacterium sp.]
MAAISIIGCGSWGTALAWLLCNNGHRLTMWSCFQEEVDMYRQFHQNTDKLPGVLLPEDVVYTTDLQQACAEKELLVMAVPSPFLRHTASSMKPFVREGQRIVNVSKGIEENTLMTMSEILEEEIPQANVAILSGPSHAEEVGRGLPTAIVAGAHDRESAVAVQTWFMSPVFRVYTSPDMRGIQLGAALKNVMALAAGIADGLGYGDNTKAALITRGSVELARLGRALGVSERTIYGLSGIGDLIVTCASMHSRNRRAGILIGQGRTMQEAMDEVHQIVEGVYSARAGKTLADRYGVDMPIVQAVHGVLFENKSAAEAVHELMQRVGKDEIEGWE